jgi:hypothetical protein
MRNFIVLVVLSISAVVGGGAVTAPADAATTGAAAPQTGRTVSEEPSRLTPNILDGTVTSIAQVGNQIVVGGTFTQVQNAGTSLTLVRNHVFSFDATTGKVDATFHPETDGTVHVVQPAADGRSVYIGGKFAKAWGSTVNNLVEADVPTGARVQGFVPPALTGEVRDLEVLGSRLWVAGKFTHVGGRPQLGLTTLNAASGAYDSYFTGVFAGLHNPGLAGSVTDVLRIATNPAGTQLMAIGNFTSVNGQDRSQIVKLDISGASYAVSPWTTDLYREACSAKFDTYMTDVNYAPDGSYFAVSTTGAYGGAPSSMAGSSGCDGVARFESGTVGLSKPTWTAYTGGDTTWTVEVTDSAIYAGGHQRWQNNPAAGDAMGQGAVERTGIAALDPVNGMAWSWNPTRTRGVGVKDMLATDQGLYVGSDTTIIGKTPGNTYHARIAMLPLAGGKTLPVVAPYDLPADVYTVAGGGAQLVRRSFDGAAVTSTSDAPTGPGWGSSVGAFMVGTNLYIARSDGTLTRQAFDGTGYGDPVTVATADALVPQTDWHGTDVPALTSLFYSKGRIYFTRSGSNLLYNRGFEVEDDIVGQQRFSSPAVSGISYSTMRGAFVAGGKLYYSNATGQLFRADWTGTGPVGPPSQVSGPGKDAQTWASRAMFVYQGTPLPTGQPPVNQPPTATAAVSCDQLVCSFDATGSSDPDGSLASYEWDFGDGSAHGSGATATHTYADAGDRVTSLTVTDDQGASARTTRTASPTSPPAPVDPPPAPASAIGFVAATNTNGNRVSHTVTVPAAVRADDTLLLFFAANTTAPTYTGPAGWTQVQAPVGSDLVGRLYTRTATASDAGSTVTITSSAYAKSDLTLAAYRGVATSGPVAASAAALQNTATATHTTPTVTAPAGTGWLVSFWADKGASTTSWAGPAGQAPRSSGGATATSGHMSSLLEDSDAAVPAGDRGGLAATANSTSRGLTMSVVLSSS